MVRPKTWKPDLNKNTWPKTGKQSKTGNLLEHIRPITGKHDLDQNNFEPKTEMRDSVRPKTVKPTKTEKLPFDTSDQKQGNMIWPKTGNL